MTRPPTPRAHGLDHAHGPSQGEAHDHGHDHGHGHAHGPGGHHHHFPREEGAHPSLQRRLRWALALTLVFLVAEVVGGFWANSLALLADAGHMLTDVAALALSLFVAWFSRQPAAPEKTYGYLRWEILAAFLNGAALLIVSGVILVEAFARLRTPEPVATGLMLAVAVGGLVVNAVCAWILHPLHAHSLNARGAYLHVLGDLLGSVGTVAAGVLILYTGWLAADPIASILVTLLIVRSSWRLVRESVDVLLESTPSHISLGAVRQRLHGVPGVSAVHDLHVWTVTSGMIAMSVHAVVPAEADHQRVLRDAVAAMRDFGIHHCTVQIECEPMCENAHP